MIERVPGTNRRHYRQPGLFLLGLGLLTLAACARDGTAAEASLLTPSVTLDKFAGVGGAHTMVLAAHDPSRDPQKDGGPWGFANSWTDDKGSHLYWMTDDELARTGKSSILNNVVVITKNP